jgi:predicted nucleotidyltransferase
MAGVCPDIKVWLLIMTQQQTIVSSPKLNISPAQLRIYKQNIATRWQATQPQREQRRGRGWQLAHQATELLKREFRVSKVVVFGSLIDPNRFTQWSDVDLAAWGLTSENWLQAIMEIYYLSDEIDLNLVDVVHCSPQLLQVIEQQGVEL